MTTKNDYGSIFTKEMMSDRVCGQIKNQMGIDMTSIYDFEVETIDRKKISMKQFEGKALIIVNTASRCGFTPHYEELEKLCSCIWKKFPIEGWERRTSRLITEGKDAGWRGKGFISRFGKALKECGGHKL